MDKMLHTYYKYKYRTRDIYRYIKSLLSDLYSELGFVHFVLFFFIRFLFLGLCVLLSLFVTYILMKREILPIASPSDQSLVDFFDRLIKRFVNYLNEPEINRQLMERAKKEEEEKAALLKAKEMELSSKANTDSQAKDRKHKTLFIIGTVLGSLFAIILYILFSDGSDGNDSNDGNN